MMLPCWIFPFGGRRRRRDVARVLFPDPDSPRTPRISPDLTSRLTSTMAEEATPARERYTTCRFRTSRMGIMSETGRCLFTAFQNQLIFCHDGLVAQPESRRGKGKSKQSEAR